VSLLQKKAVIVGLGMLLAMGLGSEVRSDILFKGRQPIKIGNGKLERGKIRWTDCSGKNADSFDAPPYSLDSTDNCSVGPPTFGLQCDGETCKVIDEVKLGKYLPGVRNGEGIRLRIDEHSVELQSASTSLRLER
jgi:hypothetical protein